MSSTAAPPPPSGPIGGRDRSRSRERALAERRQVRGAAAAVQAACRTLHDAADKLSRDAAMIGADAAAIESCKGQFEQLAFQALGVHRIIHELWNHFE